MLATVINGIGMNALGVNSRCKAGSAAVRGRPYKGNGGVLTCIAVHSLCGLVVNRRRMQVPAHVIRHKIGKQLRSYIPPSTLRLSSSSHCAARLQGRC